MTRMRDELSRCTVHGKASSVYNNNNNDNNKLNQTIVKCTWQFAITPHHYRNSHVIITQCYLPPAKPPTTTQPARPVSQSVT